MFPPLDDPLWGLAGFLIGACIGSFLNVVIYRLPRDLSVNEPRRSFCPRCKAQIAMRHNLPMVSWLWLRGKCANCGGRIAFRYFAVELLTACLFLVVWLQFGGTAPLVVPLLWLLVALLIAITFIDIEHLVIPLVLTWTGVAAGVAAVALWPRLPALGGLVEPDRLGGLVQSALGWVIGFFGLWAVVLLGKVLFGRRRVEYEGEVEWSLREADESAGRPMLFVIGDEEIEWWDMFFRRSDRLVIEASGLEVDGEAAGAGRVVIREHEVELPDGRVLGIADLRSLAGRTRQATIPREAMGMGDVHLMGMLGAFFGWAGVFFSLFAGCVLAIVAAVIGRIGFGIRLPFGPFIALGGLVWMFGGWRLWQTYLDLLGGGF